jgi:hypothetical protein
MDLSPFPFQGPLRPDRVTGRDALVDELIEHVTQRRVTALIGPRRFGKTSVLRLLESRLSEVSTVWVDLYGVESVPDLAIALDAALTRAPAPIKTAAEQIGVSAGFDLGVIRASIARPARSRPDPSALVHALLDTLVRSALSTPTLLVLDEFSAVATVSSAAARFRTALQHHYEDLGVIFAGSAPTIMRNLFTRREEPFYGQADIIEIGPLPRPVVSSLVNDGFTVTGRQAGSVAGHIYDLTAGHPQRTMQVADAVWRHTDLDGTVDDAVFAAALAELRRRIADPMARLYEAHSELERKTLRIVAHDQSPLGAAGTLLGLGKSGATRARDALLDAGDLQRDPDGHLIVTDPLLADWVRTTLPLP